MPLVSEPGPDPDRPRTTLLTGEDLQRFISRTRPGSVAVDSIVDPHEDRRKELENEGRASDNKLKTMYAKWLLGAMMFQLLVANGIFIGYGFGVDWNVQAAVMNTWLAATVVEVIGVVLVVTRYLFPNEKPS